MGLIRVERGRESLDASGSDASFEDWIAPHWPAMRRLAERLAGSTYRDDVLQEASASAWQARSRYDPARGTLRVWLLAITANHAKKQRRAARRTEPLPDLTAPERSGDAIDLDNAIRRLPARQRLAVELFYFVGASTAETAAVMGCAEGTVKSTLAAARGTLRGVLGEDFR